MQVEASETERLPWEIEYPYPKKWAKGSIARKLTPYSRMTWLNYYEMDATPFLSEPILVNQPRAMSSREKCQDSNS